MTETATTPIPAATAALPAEPARVVKRYGNRKLYDVRSSTYVSLEDLAAIVRAGETLQVLDNGTGEDITAQTLTQVILDEGKRGRSLLPTELLHAALRRGHAMTSAVTHAVNHAVLEPGREAVGQLRHGVDGLVDGLVHQSLGRLARVLPIGLPVARTDELERLRQQLADVERALAVVLARQEGRTAALAPRLPQDSQASPDPQDPTPSHPPAALPTGEPATPALTVTESQTP